MNNKNLPPDLPPVPKEKKLPPLPKVDTPKPHQKLKSKKNVTASTFHHKVGLCLMVFTLILSALFVKEQFFADPKRFPKDPMFRVVHAQLEKVSQDQGLVIKLRKLVKKDAFILLSNYKKDSYVRLEMTGVKGRTLGSSDIKFNSVGDYRDGFVYFTTFNLIKGTRLLMGEYRYHVTFTPKDGSEPAKGNGILLLSHLSHVDFEKRLKSYHLKMKKKYVDPLREKLSRYETFTQLALQSLNFYKEVMRKIKKGKEVAQFEDFYNANIGPLLRDLIIDANRLQMSYLNVDPELSQSYEDVLDFGKKVGEMASDMVTTTRKIKTLSKRDKKRLVSKFTFVYDDLAFEVQQQKKLIERELSKYPSYTEKE